MFTLYGKPLWQTALLMSLVIQCQAQVVVIGHRALHFSHLNQDQVRAIFLGQAINLETSVPLRPFNLPSSSPLYRAFYQQVVGWSEDRVSAYWADATFRGQGNMPAEVRNAAVMLAVVEGTPGAIGYVDAEDVVDYGARVKVLYGQLQSPQAAVAPAVSIYPKERPLPVVEKKAQAKIVQQAVTHKISSPVKKAPSVVIKQKKQSSVHKTVPSVVIKQKKQSSVHKKAPVTRRVIPGFWQSLSDHFTFQRDANQPLVRAAIENYIAHEKQLMRALELWSHYIDRVARLAQQADMPPEIALFPVALLRDGDAVSASPYQWWSLPEHAGPFERHQQNAVTQGVFAELNTLYGQTNDWLLALAAFRMGKTAYDQAVASNTSPDFWQLTIDPEVTAEIARLVAITEIVKYANYYNVRLPKVFAS